MTTVSYREFTGTAAENYERHFVPAIGGPVADLTLEVASPHAGERFLDVACGTGVVARLAADAVGPSGAVTGLDLAADMIDVARRAPAPAEPRIEWHVGDAASLPFPDASYDAVVCQMGLMFMPTRRRRLRRCGASSLLAAGPSSSRQVASSPRSRSWSAQSSSTSAPTLAPS